jgi:hypothetical protein
MGPALLPESLARLRKPEALKVIQQRPHGHADAGLSPPAEGRRKIAALADWIYTPVNPAPRLERGRHRRQPRGNRRLARLAGQARSGQADPMNLFVVVEGGDHHVSLVDGDRFEPIHRFASRFALHGGPKFTPDGRYVYFGSRDGWITKYDLWNLKVVAEVRAGINMRNIAVSGDGQWVMAANYLPHTVVLFDADLKPQRTYAARALDGGDSSRVSAVYDADAAQELRGGAERHLPELWEISYDPKARPSTTAWCTTTR